MTPAEYDELVFQCFWGWCKKYATSENNVQSLLANAAVNNWFMQKYAQLEQNFIDIIEHFPKKPSDINYLYHSETVEIYAQYPKPMLDAAKVINPEFQTIINQDFKVYGN